MGSNRPLKPVDLIFIACLVTLMTVALYTVPSTQRRFSQEVGDDGS